MNQGDAFDRDVETARERLKVLQEQTGLPGQLPSDQLAAAVEQLSAALEELHVAGEELHQQNQAVTAAHRALEAERQHYEDLFEGAPDGYLVTDLHGTIQLTNRPAAALLNVRPHNLPGKPLAIFVFPEDRRDFRKRLAARVREPDAIHPDRWEVRMRSRGGAVFHAALTLAPVREVGGQVTGLRWSIRNDNERKRAEERLRWESEVNAALSALYEPLIVPSCSISDIARIVLEQARRLTQSQNAFVGSVDPATGDMVIWAQTEKLPAGCEITHAGDRLSYLRDENGLYPGLPGYALNTRAGFYTNAPGTHPACAGTRGCPASLRRFLAVPVELGEELVGQIALADAKRDYTEQDLSAIHRLGRFYALAIQRLRTDETLRHANAAAEAAARAENEFLANMSHEIRTPMNAIIGTTQLLIRSQLTPQQRSQLTDVRTAADALLGLLNDILDFSRIEAGKVQLEERDFDLMEMLDQLRSTMARRASRKHLELEIRSPERFARRVRGDPLRLRQVLLQLVDNAIKFTEHGQVVVGVKEMERSDGEPEASTIQFQFSVSDTGQGIPEGKRAIIFDRCTQADGSTTRRYGGSGLGLAIVRQLVLMLGGRLWLESQVGRGSTFFFTATLKRQLAAEPADAALPAAPGTRLSRPLHILVAEDDAVSQRVAQLTIEQAGHQVVVVPDGKAVLTALETWPVDLIFMDVQMPQMDGSAATAAIRADHRWKHLPIVAMTAHAMAGDREICLAAGMDDYISKPLHIEELLAAIERHAGQIGLAADGASTRPPQQPDREASSEKGAEATSLPPVVRAEALERLDTDAADYDALLRLWLERTPPELARLAEAVERAEAPTVQAVAHKLKGACAYVGAEPMRRIAQRMEAIGHSGQLGEAPAALAELEREFHRAAAFIGG